MIEFAPEYREPLRSRSLLSEGQIAFDFGTFPSPVINEQTLPVGDVQAAPVRRQEDLEFG